MEIKKRINIENETKELKQVIENAILQVKKVDFVDKKLECIFGKKIKVNIKDEAFLARVAHDLPITKSTRLKCRLEIINQLDKDRELQEKGVIYNISFISPSNSLAFCSIQALSIYLTNPY